MVGTGVGSVVVESVGDADGLSLGVGESVVGRGVPGLLPMAMSAQPRKFSCGPHPTHPLPVSGSIPHELPESDQQALYNSASQTSFKFYK